MSKWGVNEDGISTPSYSEILDYYSERWEEEFGEEADMSSRSPEGQFLRVIAESISNKGLPWSDITSIWDAIEDVYNASFISTASGTPLDHRVLLRGVNRRDAQSATGIVVVEGNKGDLVESGTRLESESGMEFETQRPVVINRYGVASVPAQAVEEGEEGNVIAESITDGEVDVINKNDSHTLYLGSTVDSWSGIPNDESMDKYQLLPAGLVKYGTGVDEFNLNFKAREAGLYGVEIVLLDHETGKTVYTTETKEVELDSDEEWEPTFTGEDFDILTEPLSDTLRVVPVNMNYSTDYVDVGLEDNITESDWYHGSAAQNKSLTAKIVSRVKGEFTGGRDRESDNELRNRFFNSLSRGGSTRVAAIKAELYDIDTVKHVKIVENTKAIDFTPEGLPPNSIEVIVWGGSNEEILEALLKSKPAGVNTDGTNIGTITSDFGQTHQFRFSRAREVEVFVDIDIVTGKGFPASGGSQIKDACAQVIGGEDLEGAFYSGSIGVGETIYQSDLESTLHSEITGIKSIRAKIGREEGEEEDDDLEVEDRETPIVKPDNIFITHGVS